MGLLDRLFGEDETVEQLPAVKFGRYSDAYKSSEQYDHWDAALKLFDQEKYFESYEHFFQYLKDENEENLSWSIEGHDLSFEILQGSKVINGIANAKRVTVNTKVAKSKSLNVGFLRRLVEVNFDLKYCRYALDEEDNIVLIFTSLSIDSSPFKLYYALKELSTQADKLDDLLVDEFQVLEAINNNRIISLPEAAKKAKYKFTKKSIDKTLEKINEDSLFAEKYPGGIAYSLLDLCYKLDYLVKPEGYMMECLERIHRLYFEKNKKRTIERNQILINEFKSLVDRDEMDFYKEFYDVQCTFGITTAVEQAKVVGFIEGELSNMNWYLENDHHGVALAVPGYIIGYCLFNFAVPLPTRQYFHLFYQIIEQDFFNDLGYELELVDGEKLKKRNIVRKVSGIAKKYRSKYPRLQPDTSILNFRNKAAFAKSYLEMVKAFNMIEAH